MSGHDIARPSLRLAESENADNAWQLSATETDKVAFERWRQLPIPAVASLSGAAGYHPPAATVDAVNVALLLGQPLLVTGEPGCGKTSLAGWITARLGFQHLLRFQCRSTTVARELFYHFDAVARSAAAQNKAAVDPRYYITYNGLGLSVLRALGQKRISPYVVPDRLRDYPERPERSIVLIDEIDKAPRDFPNDLLGEMDNFYFDIPELSGVRISAPSTMVPVVIVTSNAERPLPDAFLRRCVYHHMLFPGPDDLEQIVHTRLPSLPSPCALVKSAVALVTGMRSGPVKLRKPPGTAELLSFVLALRGGGFGPGDALIPNGRWVSIAMTTLVKTVEDRDGALAMFAATAGGGAK